MLSAMGAGARADPTRIRIADIRKSSTDPLSRSVISIYNLMKFEIELFINSLSGIMLARYQFYAE